MRFRPTTAIRDRAREFRREQTPAERLLWEALRNRGLAGHRFRRQHPIGSYIVDFCCLKSALVVEVDGDVHAQPDQKTHDENRTFVLETMGFRVLRFQNDQVVKCMDEVLSAILAEIG